MDAAVYLETILESQAATPPPPAEPQEDPGQWAATGHSHRWVHPAYVKRFCEICLIEEPKNPVIGPAEMKPSWPATERQEATQAGPSTSFETYCLVKVGQNGEPLVMATVTYPAPSSLRRVGHVLEYLRNWVNLKQPVHMMLVSPWPYGPTPSTTPEAAEVGPTASGSTGETNHG